MKFYSLLTIYEKIDLYSFYYTNNNLECRSIGSEIIKEASLNNNAYAVGDKVIGINAVENGGSLFLTYGVITRFFSNVIYRVGHLETLCKNDYKSFDNRLFYNFELIRNVK